MDGETLKFYSENALELARKYDASVGGVSNYFRQAFIPGSKILEIGCGSGRDLRYLHEMGYSADGVDACEEFIEIASGKKTGYNTVIIKDSLPELKNISDKSYDGILCSAVLMHLPEEQLFDASFSIRRILKKDGRLLISLPLQDETIDSETKRDKLGRLFNIIAPEKIQLLFERIGFKLLSRWDSNDSMNREHRKWAIMLFELESTFGSRPIDTIESVLSKDKKVATYKLALFRALSDLAMTNYNLAAWKMNGAVEIPVENIAEKWIEYYWPIFESEKFIPQIQKESDNGKPIAFRELLTNLIKVSKLNGGMSGFSNFILNYRNNKLESSTKVLHRRLLSKIKRTIIEGPIKHAGGAGSDSVFAYDQGNLIVPAGIWMELSMMGSWIHDATILRWAELTARMSNNTIKPSEIIDCLLKVPIEERDVHSAKSFYDGLIDKVCVWSGVRIENKYAIDHAIPFVLWKNNDLWNLLPTDPAQNGKKKDMLPTSNVVKRQKNLIVYYWGLMRKRYQARFEFETERLAGIGVFKNENWENKLFATFSEAIEYTAIQRGVSRWQPERCIATGTENVCAVPELIEDCGSARNDWVNDSVYKTETIELPFFPNLEIACGVFKTTPGALGYSPAPFLGEKIEVTSVHGSLEPERHFVVRARGDSMDGGNVPIKDGDLILLELNEGGTISNQIFAVRYQDEFGEEAYVLKKIKKDPSGAYRLISNNKKYKDIPVNPENMFPFARFKNKIT